MNLMIHSDWGKVYENYLTLFTKHRNSYVNVQTSENQIALSELMNFTFRSKVVSCCLLIGSKGSGRRKALEFAVSQNCIGSFIIVDCAIYNNPVSIYEKILLECDADPNFVAEIIRNKHRQREKLANLWTTIFHQLFVRHNVVIYLNNFDVLCKKNQNFLYTILDSLNAHAPKIFVAFGTSNLLILNSLEKRIRSRFSFTSCYFGTREDKIIHFLSSFLDNCPSNADYNEIIKIMIMQASVKTKLETVFKLNNDHHLILKIFGGLFCRLSPEKLQSIFQDPSKGAEIFEKAFIGSANSLIGFNAEIIFRSLPECHKTLMQILFEFCDMNTGMCQTKALNLISAAQNKFSTVKIKVHHEYSTESIHHALADLLNIGFIIIKPFPMNPQSEIFAREDNDLKNLVKFNWKKE